MIDLRARVWCPNPDPKRAWEGRQRLSRAVVRDLGLETGYKGQGCVLPPPRS